MKLKLQSKYSFVILSIVISLVIIFASLILLQFRSIMFDVTSLTSKTLKTDLLRQLEKRAELIVLFLSENLINPVYQYDMQTIYDLAKATKKQKEVIYIYVYDRTGRIIHDGTKKNPLLDKVLDDKISKKAVAARRLIIQTVEHSLDVAMPIKIGNEVLGGIRVGFSLNGITDEVEKMRTRLDIIGSSGIQRTIRSIAIIAVGLSALGILLAVFVARGLSRPIKLLSTLSSRVGQGEYDLALSIDRSDEIGDLAVSFKKMANDLKNLAAMSRFKRYLSPQIAEIILKSEDDNLFKSHRREVTVVFMDLRGFTVFSDSAEPEEVMDLLRSYHTEIGKLIFKYDGTLEHFAGDGVMVFFNDPIPCEDHTEKAVHMGLEMRDRVKELREGWLKKGYDLDLGVGLATSYATLGNIGFDGRMDYGAVGNVTNLASRLCEQAKGGQILTNQRTHSRIEDLVEAEPMGDLHIKGFIRPVASFNIVGLKQRAESSFGAHNE